MHLAAFSPKPKSWWCGYSRGMYLHHLSSPAGVCWRPERASGTNERDHHRSSIQDMTTSQQQSQQQRGEQPHTQLLLRHLRTFCVSCTRSKKAQQNRAHVQLIHGCMISARLTFEPSPSAFVCGNKRLLSRALFISYLARRSAFYRHHH